LEFEVCLKAGESGILEERGRNVYVGCGGKCVYNLAFLILL
jgi:hypothetical protein